MNDAATTATPLTSTTRRLSPLMRPMMPPDTRAAHQFILTLITLLQDFNQFLDLDGSLLVTNICHLFFPFYV